GLRAHLRDPVPVDRRPLGRSDVGPRGRRPGRRDPDDGRARPSGPRRRTRSRPARRDDDRRDPRRRPGGVVTLLADAGTTVFSGSLLLALPIAVLAGLLSFASPCVLPLVPGYLGYLGGMAGAVDARPARR